MSLFIPLDVEYSSDDEFIEAGPLAELLYVRGLCFIKRKMTDGQIRRSQLAVVAANIPSAIKHADRLVSVGLWRVTKDGWVVPAYLKRNSSKAEIEAGKQIASEAGARGNHERWHIGPEGKPSPKCRICRSEIIGSPESGGNRVGSPLPETETETEPEALPQPQPEPLTEPENPASVRQNVTTRAALAAVPLRKAE